MQKSILDFLMPNNCKAKFKKVVEKNAEIAADILRMTHLNREKIIHEITTPSFLKVSSK